jgi:7-cyano-7-deazaguanine reductase
MRGIYERLEACEIDLLESQFEILWSGYNPQVLGNDILADLVPHDKREMPSKPNKKLETFANPPSARDYRIHMEIPEFTCLCPRTGQPDFATLVLDYVPDRLCVELKSLKLYVWSFRNEGAFHEAVTNRMLADLVRATRPRFMRLTARFNVRGGIFTTVVAEHRKPGWKPMPEIDLSRLPVGSSTRG